VKLAVRLALPLLVLSAAALPAAGMTEFRGLYVDAFHPGIKNHEQVTQMVSAAKAANFNALIVQVRKRGDAYYNSKIEPKASDIAPDYDPLADVIQQAHAVDLEVHAWLAVYEVALESKWFECSQQNISLSHPEWLMCFRDGKTTLAHSKIWVDPGVPAVQDHFVSIVLDLLKKYAVDGIHLDNIRYPDAKSGYNATSLERFNGERAGTDIPADDDTVWNAWRCRQITDLVRKVKASIETTKPEVKLSASVCSESPKLASEIFLQEWSVWTRDNLMDFVVPMVYLTVDRMPRYAAHALTAAYNRDVYVGIGAYRLSADLASKHITDVRGSGGLGIVVYSYHYLRPDVATDQCAKLSDLRSSVFTDAAAVPAMPWKQQEAN